MRLGAVVVSCVLAASAASAERLAIKTATPACPEAAMLSYIDAHRSGNVGLMMALIDEAVDDPPCVVLVPGELVAVSPAGAKSAIVAIERQDGSVWTIPSPAAQQAGGLLPPGLEDKYREWSSGPVRLKPVRPAAFGVGARMVARDDLALACRDERHAADIVALFGNPDAYNAVRASYVSTNDCKSMRVGEEAVVVEDDLSSHVVRVRLLPSGPDAWVDIFTAYGSAGARERAAKRAAYSPRAQR